VNVLLVYTHYFGLFVVLSQVLAIIIFQRIKLSQVLLMFGIVFAGFTPWAVAVFRAANAGADVNQNIGWVERPGLLKVFDLVFDLVEPFYFQASNAEPISLLYISIPILLIIAAAKILFLLEWKIFEEKNPIYLLLIFTSVPVAIAFAASWALPVSVWGSRHLIIVFPPAMILTGIVLTNIKWNAVKIGLLSALGVIVVAAFLTRLQTRSQVYIWCGWEQLAAEWILTPQYSSEPKKLYVFEELVAYHFWFATRNFDRYEVNLIKGMSEIPEDSAYFLPRGFDSVKTFDRTAIDDGRFWIAFRIPESREDAPGISHITRLKPPLSVLAESGFVSEDVRKFRTENETAYLVLMQRDIQFTANP
ncbi:MAG: hypothetical protein ACT4O9_17715, partial [Blastocatellia bacterium]